MNQLTKTCKTCNNCVGRKHIHVTNLYYFCRLTASITDLTNKCDKWVKREANNNG